MADATAAINSYKGTGIPGSRGLPGPIKASETIEQGTMSIITAGYHLDGSAAAASVFGGVAAADYTGGATDGAEMGYFIRRGVFSFKNGNNAVTDYGKEVYISDNQTVTITDPGGGAGIKCGRIVGWDTDDGLWATGCNALVKIDACC